MGQSRCASVTFASNPAPFYCNVRDGNQLGGTHEGGAEEQAGTSEITPLRQSGDEGWTAQQQARSRQQTLVAACCVRKLSLEVHMLCRHTCVHMLPLP